MRQLKEVHLLGEFSRSTTGSLFSNEFKLVRSLGRAKEIGGWQDAASNTSEPDLIDPIIRIRVGDESNE